MRRVFYGGKLVLTVDEKMIIGSEEYQCIRDLLDMWSDKAFDDFVLPSVEEYEKSIWRENEVLRKFGEEVHKIIESERDYEGLEIFAHMDEESDKFRKLMLEKVSEDELSTYYKLNNICVDYDTEKTRCFNDGESDKYIWYEDERGNKYSIVDF